MSKEFNGVEWITSRSKRNFDIAVSGILSPLLIPISAIGASAFFAESRVNPLFYQARLGRGNKPIQIMKLRTMPFNYDFSDGSNGHADVRASKVGKVLRKYALDEAPQVLHIFAGQMSVVGPRPLVRSDVENTLDQLNPKEQKQWQIARSVAKPGWFSDFGNLSRTLGEKADNYYLARVESDCLYLETASLETDLRMIKTALGVGVELITN